MKENLVITKTDVKPNITEVFTYFRWYNIALQEKVKNYYCVWILLLCLVSTVFGFYCVWFLLCLVSTVFGFYCVWFLLFLVSTVFGFYCFWFLLCLVSTVFDPYRVYRYCVVFCALSSWCFISTLILLYYIIFVSFTRRTPLQLDIVLTTL
ncbi:hypothetical protein H8356DRAFT_1352163 [Neocallimastix lanati (nom. inval.)]|nr:hypothetical protein H8356DRAFT_1352163 [Neocallimastix sp. JGI-2020a]